ncbi:MAG: alpha/beta fold hydrolase [Thermoproteota archaeon]
MRQDFVDVGGLKVRYLEASGAIGTEGSVAGQEAKGRYVLFIHGLGSSADRWLDIPDALSLLGLHSVAIDLPGFGLSDKPEIDYTIGRFVEVVAGFIRKTGMQRANIVGHSLGGYIAAQLAAEHADLVDRLVLIDTSGMLDGPTPLLTQYLEVAMNPEKKAVRAVLEQLAADPIRIPEVLVDGFIYRMHQAGAKHAFKSAYENSVNTQIGTDRLKRIGAPTLIIWGRRDNLIPLDHFRTFQESIAGSKVVIVEDAGHAPFAEKPAIAGELLHKFLLEEKR